jgi:hypothetical protein
MKKALLSLPVLLAMSAPAQATGGLVCRTAGVRPIELSLVTGHAAVESVVSARLRDNGRNVPVKVAQSWLDAREVRIDLVDPNAMRRETRLIAKKNGRFYDGTMLRGGRSRWVRCREG